MSNRDYGAEALDLIDTEPFLQLPALAGSHEVYVMELVPLDGHGDFSLHRSKLGAAWRALALAARDKLDWTYVPGYKAVEARDSGRMIQIYVREING